MYYLYICLVSSARRWCVGLFPLYPLIARHFPVGFAIFFMWPSASMSIRGCVASMSIREPVVRALYLSMLDFPFLQDDAFRFSVALRFCWRLLIDPFSAKFVTCTWFSYLFLKLFDSLWAEAMPEVWPWIFRTFWVIAKLIYSTLSVRLTIVSCFLSSLVFDLLSSPCDFHSPRFLSVTDPSNAFLCSLSEKLSLLLTSSINCFKMVTPLLLFFPQRICSSFVLFILLILILTDNGLHLLLVLPYG
jgi:hypothetical protein